MELYRLRANEISLIILDLVMPDMSGKECFKGLKALNPDVRVVLSTGYSMDGKVQEIVDLGLAGFVQKPYRIETIGREIRAVLDRAPQTEVDE